MSLSRKGSTDKSSSTTLSTNGITSYLLLYRIMLFFNRYLIKSAAERGNAFYQCRLGDFYRDGVKMQVGTHKETRKDTDGGWYDSEDKVREYWDDYRLEWVTVYQIEVADYKTILPKDMKQAKYWWKKAADNGNETAKERLQQIYE